MSEESLLKTPEEIKKGLAACSADECHGQHDGCTYQDQFFCTMRMCGDALAYIQQLESDNAAKQERIEELDQMVTMASRQLSLDLGRLEYYADEKKRTDETLSYAHGEMMKLRVELHEAKSRLAQVERERDAAVHDLEKYKGCGTCKFQDVQFECDDYQSCAECDNADCPCYGISVDNCWQWRGVCDDDTEEDE